MPGNRLIAKFNMKENNQLPDSDDSEGSGNESAMKKTILVVDDDLDIGRAIKDYFECEDDSFQVNTAVSGNSAIVAIDQKLCDPDVILSDVHMPDGTGEDLFKWLQEKRPDLTKKAIFMTAGKMGGWLEGFICKMLWQKRLLEKPFSFETMRLAINNILSGKNDLK